MAKIIYTKADIKNISTNLAKRLSLKLIVDTTIVSFDGSNLEPLKVTLVLLGLNLCP